MIKEVASPAVKIESEFGLYNIYVPYVHIHTAAKILTAIRFNIPTPDDFLYITLSLYVNLCLYSVSANS